MPDSTDNPTTDPPVSTPGPDPPVSPDTEPIKDPPPPPSDQDFDRFQGLEAKLGSIEKVEKYLGIVGSISALRKEDEAAAEAAYKKLHPDPPAPTPRKPEEWEPKTWDEKEASRMSALTSTELKRAEEILKENGINLDLTDRKGLEVIAPVRPAGFGPRYLDVGAWNFENTKADHAVNLTAANWSEILQVNKCLYGFTISDDGKDVAKARLPAFVMAASNLHQPITPKFRDPNTVPARDLKASDELGVDGRVVDAMGNAAIKAEVKKEEARLENAKTELMPEFEVADGSSISIHETTTELQKSLAENGFSSLAVQASASGGAFGVSAGVSAGLRKDDASGTASTDISAEKEYFATYNFPRARVYMDSSNLALSPQATSYLNRIVAEYNKEEPNYLAMEAALVDFSEKFGHVFATRFQLGGQLLSTKFASSTFEGKEEDYKNALKTALAVSWSSQYTSGSASTSYENQSHENSQSQTTKEVSRLAWTARGGNTLLCANPPLWASTVATPSNWRTIEQEKVVPLYELYGMFNGFEDIPNVFKEIAQQKKKKKDDDSARNQGVWANKIKLLYNGPGQYNGARLGYDAIDTNTLRMRSTTATADDPEPVFTVLNGNFKETSDAPLFTTPLYDRTLFLVAGSTYQRDKKRGNQIPGLWVDSYGKIKPETSTGSKIARWSLRRLEDTNTRMTQMDALIYGMGNRKFKGLSPPWDTINEKVIKDGDQVVLYSHSVDIGFFRDPNNAPSDASPVTTNAVVEDGTLRVWGFGDPVGGGWDRSIRYDNGSMTERDVEYLYNEGDVQGRRLREFGTGNYMEAQAMRLGFKVAVFTVKFE